MDLELKDLEMKLAPSPIVSAALAIILDIACQRANTQGSGAHSFNHSFPVSVSNDNRISDTDALDVFAARSRDPKMHVARMRMSMKLG